MSAKLKNIPLCQLRRSSINVRKTDPLTDIEQLAASIKDKGLLENLVVTPGRGDKGGEKVFDVTAGGRRLAALRLLAKRKAIPRDHPVACLVRSAEDAAEVSLIENFARVPLHPADQFEAFAALVQNGSSFDDVAARFGVTPLFVEQRLKLASVSPRLVAEYRGRTMTLEQLTAFTIIDDHSAQEAVWFDHPFAQMTAAMIRRLLTQAKVESGDRRARFIGAPAYRGAGGIIVRDLFDSEDEGYFGDSQLLDRLVAEKLKISEAEVLAEGWSWVEIHPECDYAYLGRLGRAKTELRTLGKVDERRLVQLTKRHDKLAAELEESEGGSDELDAVSADLVALRAKKEVWPDAEKARAGAIVGIGPDGELEVFRGLVRRSADAKRGDADADPKKASRNAGYADAVLVDLSAHRTAALREMLAGQPEEALLALLQALAGQLLYRGASGSCLGIAASEVMLDRASPSVGTSKAAEAFHKRHADWTQKLPQIEELGPWLRQLSKADRLRLLAHCVAMTVNALHGATARYGSQEDSDTLAVSLGLDMAKWWRPTRDNFLGRVSKPDILAAVLEGTSSQAASRLAGLKKDEMAAEAEKVLTDSKWVPLSLRTVSNELEAAAE